MADDERHALIAKIAAAKQAVVEAEVALDAVIGEIAVVERAQKVSVSLAVEAAFTKLRVALSQLAELQALLAKLPDD